MAVRHYELDIVVDGLVHIGTGGKLGSKDYFRLNDKQIAVLDVKKFVAGLTPEQLRAYLSFLQRDSKQGLQDFLDESGAGLGKLAGACVAYRLDAVLARARRGSYQYFDAFEFVKDAQGNPYVPGSSIKGMLRTALLVHMIQADRPQYARLYDAESARSGKKDADREMMRHAFWRLHPDPADRSADADIMRYVSVSDSESLSVRDLVFAKKYDKFSKADDGRHKKQMGKISNAAYYEGSELNIYRECLRPGTHVRVRLDIDDRIDEYLGSLRLDAEGLQGVLRESFELYDRCFLSHFDVGGASSKGGNGSAADGRCQYVMQAGPLAGSRCRNAALPGSAFCGKHQDAQPAAKPCTVYLGGGVDFDSKTVVNALFEDDYDRLNEVSRILYGQFTTKIDRSRHAGLWRDVEHAGFRPQPMEARFRGPKLVKAKDDHRHWRDPEFHVSPHTLKLGIVGKEKHPMGKCSLSIKERS